MITSGSREGPASALAQELRRGGAGLPALPEVQGLTVDPTSETASPEVATLILKLEAYATTAPSAYQRTTYQDPSDPYNTTDSYNPYTLSMQLVIVDAKAYYLLSN